LVEHTTLDQKAESSNLGLLRKTHTLTRGHNGCPSIVNTRVLLDYYPRNLRREILHWQISERIIESRQIKTSFTIVQVLLDYYPQHLMREILHRQISETIIKSRQTKTSFAFVQVSYNYTNLKNITIWKQLDATEECHSRPTFFVKDIFCWPQFLNHFVSNMTPNFWQHCYLSITNKKIYFSKFNFLVKMNLVPTVQAETSQL
jgi:hypothetical protein